MNIISFDINKRNTTIELSTTEARQIRNLLYFSIEENKEDSNKELYKDFFILVELLTSKRLDSWALEYYKSISEGDKE